MTFLQQVIVVLLCVVLLVQLRILSARKARIRRSAADEPAARPRPSASVSPVRAGSPADGDDQEADDEEDEAAEPRRGGDWGRAIRSFFGAVEEEDEEEKPPIDLLASSALTQQMGADHLDSIYTSPALLTARWILAEPLQRRCEMVTIDCRHQSAAMRYMVDGVWHNGQPLARAEADAALAAIKALCGVDPATVSDRVRGQCEAVHGSQRRKVAMAGQRQQGGERAVLQFQGPATQLPSFAEIGLRDELRERFCEVLDKGSGIVLLSAPPANGLRTTTSVVLHHFDRLTREVVSIEDQANRYPAVEAVEVRTYAAARGESPIPLFRDVFDLEPDMVVLRDPGDGPTVDALCRHLEARKTCLALSTTRTGDCAESLMRVLFLRVERVRFARQVTAVLSQRLIRKLCNRCKEPFTPPVELVERLGLAPRRRTTFYRPPKPSESVCPECGGLGYRGRTGIFELLLVDDTLRQVLAYQPSLESLRQAAWATRAWSMEREGALLVDAGVTSLQELARVLRLPSAGSPGAPAPSHVSA